MTKIKFCGLSRPCDIDYVNEIKPDYVGFVFYKKSRRYISFEQAEKLKSLLNPEIKSVGVFVNESPEEISAIRKSAHAQSSAAQGRESSAAKNSSAQAGVAQSILRAVRNQNHLAA